jgi:hypothetical protein
MRRPVVFPQQVPAEVTVEIPPYGVDMIGAVLDIVVLDQKSGSLNTVIMGMTRFDATSPAEISLILFLPVRRGVFLFVI